MSARVLVTVGGRAATPVIAGLLRLPIEVWAAAPRGMEGLVPGLPRARRLVLERADARDGGEEILELSRQVRAEAVIPTGDADLHAASQLAWVFDLRRVALAAPASWTLDACADPGALSRTWAAAGRSGPVRGRPGDETWWDVIADREGGLRWIQTRGVGSGRDALVRVSRTVRALGLRYATSLRMRIDEEGQGDLVEVVPRFSTALVPVMARGINLPRIVLEAVLQKDLPRVEAPDASKWSDEAATRSA